LDAADASSMVLEGSRVAEWHDKSGHVRHLSQATVSQQPYYTEQIGNKNVVTFDGIENNLDRDVFGFDWDGSPFSMLMVVELDAGVSAYRGLFTNRVGAEPTWLTFGNKLGEGVTAIENGSAGDPVLYILGDNDRGQGLFTHLLTHDETVLNYYKELEFKGGIVMTDRTMGGTLHPFILGSWLTINQAWKGKMAEIILYDRVLTSPEFQTLREYLMHKWGVS